MKFLTAKDILNLPSYFFPVIITSDNPWSFCSLVVRLRSRVMESHTMWLYKPGYVATQGFLYHEAPIKDFLKNNTLRLFSRHWTPNDKRDLLVRIQGKLESPWYKRRYDVVGVFGQALHLPKINLPYLNYCSESVISDLHFIDLALDLPLQSTPGQLHQWCLKNPDMVFLGAYIPNLLEGEELKSYA